MHYRVSFYGCVGQHHRLFAVVRAETWEPGPKTGNGLQITGIFARASFFRTNDEGV
jgi:hypothetical protein